MTTLLPSTSSVRLALYAGIGSVFIWGCSESEPSAALTDAAAARPTTPNPNTSPGQCDVEPCLPLERANWPMPNSKNLALPNAAQLDVVAGASDELFDALTGLTWSTAHSASIDFFAAGQYCATLAEGSDWRLPTRLELVSIVDRTYTPTLDPQFGETPSDYFWTSTPVPDAMGLRVSVYFGVGETARGPEEAGAFTRCVRGGFRVASPEYLTEADEVHARGTGLRWQHQGPGAALSLAAAHEYCAGVVHDGMPSRLPTSKELQTLLDPSLRSGPAWLDGTTFDVPPGREYWADEGPTLPPMHVDFGSGFAGIEDIGAELFVRCVR